LDCGVYPEPEERLLCKADKGNFLKYFIFVLTVLAFSDLAIANHIMLLST